MSDIVRLLIMIVLLVVGVCAYFLVLNALFTPRIVRTKSAAQSMPVRSFGLGLVNFLFFAVIALVLLSAAENAGPFTQGILSIPAVILLAFLAAILSFGLAAMSNLVGERIFPELPAWQQMVWGTVCLSLACGLPFVGWFLLLPYAGFVGIGGVIIGFFQRENKT